MSEEILIADDDPLSTAVLEGILTQAGRRVAVARDGEAAWEILRGEDPPRIAFLDWMMPGVEGVELCRRLRALDRPFYTYVTILSTRQRQRDIARGFDAGADDFITKPFLAGEVLARLRAAERVRASLAGDSDLEAAIAEARASGRGDVVIRSGASTGRIRFEGGRVVAASVTGQEGGYAAFLAGEEAFTPAAIESILAEAEAHEVSPTRVILERGLMGAERLRLRLRAWLAGVVAAILRLPTPTAIFVPGGEGAPGAIGFDYDELVRLRLIEAEEGPEGPEEVAANSPNAALSGGESLRALGAALDRAMAIPGALGAAIVDGRTGQRLAARGEAIDRDLAWRSVKLALATEEMEAVDDVIVTTTRAILVLRAYSRQPQRFLLLMADGALSKLGIVRHQLAGCAAT